MAFVDGLPVDDNAIKPLLLDLIDSYLDELRASAKDTAACFRECRAALEEANRRLREHARVVEDAFQQLER